MTTATVVFLVIGGIGMLLLALSLLGVELFELDGFASMEAISAMLAGFGLGSAVASSLFDAHAGPALVGAAAVGVAAALPAGWLAVQIGRAANRMPTDATPVRSDLVGLLGVVVTPIPARGYGEVRVVLGGQPVKLNASAGTEIPLGAQVFVITASSDTSVVVEQTPATPEPFERHQP